MKIVVRMWAVASLVWVAVGCQSKEEKSPPVEVSKKPTVILALGKVEPENTILQLAAPQGGVIERVWVKEGDTVQQGQILVQLNTLIDQTQIQEIDQKKQTQRIQNEELVAQQKELMIQIQDQQEKAAKLTRLEAAGAETKQAVQDIQVNLDRLQAQWQVIQSQRSTYQSREKEWDAQKKVRVAELKEKSFAAPQSGVILDLKVRAGEAAQALQTYAELAPLGKWIIRAEVDEMYSTQIKVGQAVQIVSPGTDVELTKGRIERVIPYLKRKSLFSENVADQEDRRVLEIRIALESTQQLLINSKVECLIRP